MPWDSSPEKRQRDSRRYGREWRKARQRQLEADRYRCQLTLPGCTVRATEVDHVLGAANDPGHTTLRSVCRSCHTKVTAQQGGGFRSGGEQKRTDPEPKQSTQW